MARLAANGFVFWIACRSEERTKKENEKKRERNGGGAREKEKREIHNRVGEKKKRRKLDASWDGGVIFIRNVPRASDGSYVIAALTAAKLRLRQPKSRPRAEVRCASIKAITPRRLTQSPCGIVNRAPRSRANERILSANARARNTFFIPLPSSFRYLRLLRSYFLSGSLIFHTYDSLIYTPRREIYTSLNSF